MSPIVRGSPAHVQIISDLGDRYALLERDARPATANCTSAAVRRDASGTHQARLRRSHASRVAHATVPTCISTSLRPRLVGTHRHPPRVGGIPQLNEVAAGHSAPRYWSTRTGRQRLHHIPTTIQAPLAGPSTFQAVHARAKEGARRAGGWAPSSRDGLPADATPPIPIRITPGAALPPPYSPWIFNAATRARTADPPSGGCPLSQLGTAPADYAGVGRAWRWRPTEPGSAHTYVPSASLCAP